MDNAPDKGLVVRWYPDETLDIASAPPDELLADIERLFGSCVRKFQSYLGARRIVLIDQYGDLRYLGDSWWMGIFNVLPPPSGISDIWISTYDWITDLEEDWTFEKIYPEELKGTGVIPTAINDSRPL